MVEGMRRLILMLSYTGMVLIMISTVLLLGIALFAGLGWALISMLESIELVWGLLVPGS